MEIKTVEGNEEDMRLKPLLAQFRKNQRHHRKLYFVSLFGLGIILFLPIFYQINHQEFRSLGLIGVFFLNLIGSATIFLPTPAFLSVGISATRINPLLVALVAASGGAIGEGTTFLFGYTSAKAFNLGKHKSLKRFKQNIFDKWGGLVILIFAFFPNPLFDGIGMVAGVSKYPIKRFLVLTFLGRLLRYIVIGYVSSYLVYR